MFLNQFYPEDRLYYEHEKEHDDKGKWLDYVSMQWLGRSCGARVRDAKVDTSPINTQGIVCYEGNVFEDHNTKNIRHVVSTKNGDLTFFFNTTVVK